jgi:hypothetical protein
MRYLFIMLCVGAALTLSTAVQAQNVASSKLFFESDMVRGAPGSPTGPTCVLTSQFKHKESVAWRVRVLDQTGKSLDDKALKSLVVEIPDGKTFPLHFTAHPRGRTDDYFWATSWVIPEDYPTGTLSYKVIATDLQGGSQTWEPFKVIASQLTVIP